MEKALHYTVWFGPLAFLLVYGGWLLWLKRSAWRLPPGYERLLLGMHGVLAFLVLLLVVLYNCFNGLMLHGLWTNRIILIVFLLTGMITSPLLRGSLSRLDVKRYLKVGGDVYFRMLSVLPLIAGVLAAIPFIGTVMYMSLLGILFTPADTIYFQDARVMAVARFEGALASDQQVTLITRGTFFDRELSEGELARRDIPQAWGTGNDKVYAHYATDSVWIIFPPILEGLVAYQPSGTMIGFRDPRVTNVDAKPAPR